jgi:hypothetical protein
MKKIILTVALALMAGMLPTSTVQAQDVITSASQIDPAAAAKAEKEARKAQKAQEKAEKKAKKAEKEAKKRKKAREDAEDAKKDAENQKQAILESAKKDITEMVEKAVAWLTEHSF